MQRPLLCDSKGCFCTQQKQGSLLLCDSKDCFCTQQSKDLCVSVIARIAFAAAASL